MRLHETLRAIAAQQPDAPCLPGHTWSSFVGALPPPRPGTHPATDLLELLSGGLPIPPEATPYERDRLLADLAHPTEAFWLLTTSGSLGEPRRVALSEEAVMWNARAHADALALPFGVRTLVLSSLTHAFPLVAVALATLLRGGSLAWLPGSFTPKAFMSQEGIGYAAVPLPLLRLLALRNPDAKGLPPIMSVGAAPVAPDELESLMKWAARGGSRLYHTYGLTEAGPRVATLTPDDGRHDTVGKPLPGIEVQVREGEIWIKTPSRMLGYYPDVDDDEWLATGDLGTFDGFLKITGRRKDVIVAGGVTIWAREVEEALEADARVAVAAVVGRAHPVYGEVPVAFVEGALTPEEALAGLTGRLSRPKLPHQVVVLPALPRTPLGKVDKQQLREAACEASR